MPHQSRRDQLSKICKERRKRTKVPGPPRGTHPAKCDKCSNHPNVTYIYVIIIKCETSKRELLGCLSVSPSVTFLVILTHHQGQVSQHYLEVRFSILEDIRNIQRSHYNWSCQRLNVIPSYMINKRPHTTN